MNERTNEWTIKLIKANYPGEPMNELKKRMNKMNFSRNMVALSHKDLPQSPCEVSLYSEHSAQTAIGTLSVSFLTQQESLEVNSSEEKPPKWVAKR